MPDTTAPDEKKGPEKKEETNQPSFVALALGAMVLLGGVVHYGPDWLKYLKPQETPKDLFSVPGPSTDMKPSEDQLRRRMAGMMAQHIDEEKKQLTKAKSFVSIKAKNECDRKVWVAFSYNSIDNKTIVSGWWKLEHDDSLQLFRNTDNVFQIYVHDVRRKEMKGNITHKVVTQESFSYIEDTYFSPYQEWSLLSGKVENADFKVVTLPEHLYSGVFEEPIRCRDLK